MKRKSSDLNPSSSAAKSPVTSANNTKPNTNETGRTDNEQQQRASFALSGGNTFNGGTITNNGGNSNNFQIQEQLTQQIFNQLHQFQLQQFHDHSQATQMASQMANHQHNLSYPCLQQLTPLSADKPGFLYAPIIQSHLSLASEHQKSSNINSPGSNHSQVTSNNACRSASAKSQSPSSPRTDSPLSKSFPNNKLYSSLMDTRKANNSGSNSHETGKNSSQIFTFPQQPLVGVYTTSNLNNNTHLLNTPNTPSTSALLQIGQTTSLSRGRFLFSGHCLCHIF